jgi:DNA-binding transcriptional LysR family regulator
MRGLNLDQLRTFAAVVSRGSFSAAAKELNLSQPAVSLQVRELETRLGVRLVDRLGKRAFATPAGADLLAHAESLFAEVDRTLATMRRHREGGLGRVRIGTFTSTLTYLLVPVLGRLRRAHRGLDIAIETGASDELIEKVVRNELDLGLVMLPVLSPLLDVVPVREDAILGVFPTALAPAKAAVSAADFIPHTLILGDQRTRLGQLFRDWQAAQGVTQSPAMEIDNVEAIKGLVAAGLGVSVMLSEAVGRPVPDGIAVRRLTPPLTRTLALVQRRDKPADPALTLAREAILTLRPGKTARGRGRAPQRD